MQSSACVEHVIILVPRRIATGLVLLSYFLRTAQIVADMLPSFA